jgi:hypothetical protein
MKMNINGGEYKALLGVWQLLRRQAVGCGSLEMAMEAGPWQLP